MLTVRASEQSEDPEEIEEILLPTDGSEYATRAVDHALATAAAFDAQVHSLHVVKVGSVVASPDFTAPSSLLDDLESLGESATEAVAARTREAGLSAVTSVRMGNPAASILEDAEEKDIDLITMGTAG